MDAFLLSLIPVGVDPRIRDVVALILAHKIMAAGAFLLSSGLAAPVIAWILNKIPIQWWYSFVESSFFCLSRVGNTRLGKLAWKPIEEALIKFIGGTADAAEDGLMRDDLPGIPAPKNDSTPGTTTPPPPL